MGNRHSSGNVVGIEEQVENKIVLGRNDEIMQDLRRWLFFNRHPQIPEILLFCGTPGLGKSFLIQKFIEDLGLANELFTTTNYMDPYQGVSETNFQEVFNRGFDHYEKTGEVFAITIDEADSMLKPRGRISESTTEGNIKSIFLKNTDSAQEARPGVIIFAMTNKPWDLDGAMIDRCARTIMLDFPSDAEKKQFFDYYISEKNIYCSNITEEDLKTIDTNKFSIRNFRSLIKCALDMGPWKRFFDETHYRTVLDYDQTTKFEGCSCPTWTCGGVSMTQKEIEDNCTAEDLILSILTLKDLQEARKIIEVSTSDEDIKQMKDWFQNRNRFKAEQGDNNKRKNIEALESQRREATMNHTEVTCWFGVFLFICFIVFFSVIFYLSITGIFDFGTE